MQPAPRPAFQAFFSLTLRALSVASVSLWFSQHTGGTIAPPFTLDVLRLTCQDIALIRSFKDDRTEALYAGTKVDRRFSAIARQARIKLRLIDAAETLAELRSPPGNRLERLKGDRKGQQSIRINDQWRVCFRWRAPHAYDVELNKHYER